jgi:hypothetical protein
MNPSHLDPLKRQLLKAAQDLMSCTDTNEFHSFDLIADGQRLVIEIAVLPPVTRNCEGAQRATPPDPADEPLLNSGKSRSGALIGQGV